MENNNKIKLEIMGWMKDFTIAIVIALFINTFIFRVTRVKGDSMNPTLKEKDRMISNKISLYLGNPVPEDIIVLKIPNIKNQSYIKRVIGVEGDKIEILDGKVYLNDKLLKEDYIEKDSYTHTEKKNLWIVPKGELFVLGDNRNLGASLDSRSFGTIPLSSVKGISNFRYFPFGQRFGNINKTP